MKKVKADKRRGAVAKIDKNVVVGLHDSEK
jgi:hypothetical protein